MSKNLTENQKIGLFIKNLRESKDWTQGEFAKELGTSQSAVARMESGEQNFTTETLTKISETLNHKIIQLADNSVDFEVEGGQTLSGSIDTNTSKNGAMGLLCASLLNKGTTILHGIPQIEEVKRILEVLESIDVRVDWVGKNSLKIQPPKKLALDKINISSASKTRTIIMFIGAIIHLENSFSLPGAAGCKLGTRSIAAHAYGLENFGVKIKVGRQNFEISHKGLKPSEFVMWEMGDTATENLLIAASKIPGKSLIKFASSNYMVQDVCFFLQKLGVRIEGIGTHTITVYGKENINEDVEFYNSEDPIEAMMFVSAAIVTNSQITIKRVPIDFMEMELLKLEKLGFKYKKGRGYKSKNGETNLVDITTFPSTIKSSPEKITSGPYPNINMDNLPFFVPIMALSKGTTLIHDWSYENRAIYFMELTRLGAKMILADPHRVYVEGITEFQAAQVVCPPALRPAMIVLIAMLGAKGKSVLRNVYSIKRGYEEIAERLNTLGAKIKVIDGV